MRDLRSSIHDPRKTDREGLPSFHYGQAIFARDARVKLWVAKLPPLSNPVPPLRFGRGSHPSLSESQNQANFKLRSTIHDLPQKTDREGFEPSVTLPPHTLSKRAHSTTLTPALGRRETRERRMAWQSHFICELWEKSARSIGMHSSPVAQGRTSPYSTHILPSLRRRRLPLGRLRTALPPGASMARA